MQIGKVVVICLAVNAFALTASTFGQQQGGGGPAHDTNPYNLANWESMPTIGNATRVGTSWMRNEQGVVSSSTATIVDIPAPEEIHYVTIPTNTSLEQHSAKHVATASVTMRKRWIGLGPGPDKVWIVKMATAGVILNPDGTGEVSNGLGSDTRTETDAGTKTVTASGAVLTEVTLSGGVLEVPFSMSATGIASNSSAPYYNSAQAYCGYNFVFKGAYISGPGTSRNVDGYPVANTFADRRTDIGTVAEHEDCSFMATWMGRTLFGNWQNPFHEWRVIDTSYIDTLFSEYEQVPLDKHYSKDESNSNVTSRFQYGVQLKIKDILNPEMPGGPIEEFHDVFVYAPIYKPVILNTSLDASWSVHAQAGISPPVLTNNSATVHYNYAQAASTFFGILSNISQGGGALAKLPWVEAIGSAIGIVAQQLQALDVSDMPFFNACYADADSTFYGTKQDPMTQWEMITAQRLVKFRNIYSRAEKYGLQGYQGYILDSSKKIEHAKTVGVFQLIGGTSGGSPGGSSGGSNGGGSGS